MRLRLAGLLVLAAVAAGCGHHAAAIPRLAHVPPSALGRSFVVDLRGEPSRQYVRLLRREALAARAQPVDVRAVGGSAAVTLAASDPAVFLKHRLQRFLDRTSDVFECSPIQPLSRPVGARHPRCPGLEE